MLFTSYGFIAFIAALFLVYYIFPRKYQWCLLLVASYIFYAFAGLDSLVFILTTTLSSYAVALIMGRMRQRENEYVELNKDSLDKEAKKAYRAKQRKRRFPVLVAGLVFNFGILAVIKYTGFAISNFNSIIVSFGKEPLTIPSLLLPMGISFYIFQSMGYLIDVYRGKAEPEKNVARFALFVSFFPQLVQGPISRFSDLAPQLFTPHKFNGKSFTFGIQRILWGYFKKLVIADRIVVLMTTMLDEPTEYTGAYVLLLIVVYSIQIFADFTGGIDITIGIAEALGIRLAENFKHPFSSTSTKEYWNRWHITMGSWFNDYVFNSLSVCGPMKKFSTFSRKRFGKALGMRVPVYISTIVTWFLTGLWHGAGWNFIVWGLLNCAVILVSREFEPLYKKFRNKFPRLVAAKGYYFFSVARTFLLMGTIRSLDCYRDVGLTFKLWGSMFTTFNYGKLFDGGILDLGLDVSDFVIIAVAVAIVCFVGVVTQKRDVREVLYEKPALNAALAVVLFIAIILFGAYGINYDATQFIYNQF